MTEKLQGNTVLIVDDDPDLCLMLKLALERQGAEVFTAPDGEKGLQTFYAQRPDLVILDILMPRMDGWETCRQMRLLADTPIIMLTALTDEQILIRGLDAGADDFIRKPFSPDVLFARMRAVLRRTNEDQAGEITAHYKDSYLEIDMANRRVRVSGHPVKLTSTEFRLLNYLLQNANQVMPYRQILQHVWGWEYRDAIDYAHVYISHLRQKLEPDPKAPRYLLNEYGVGYLFARRSNS